MTNVKFDLNVTLKAQCIQLIVSLCSRNLYNDLLLFSVFHLKYSKNVSSSKFSVKRGLLVRCLLPFEWLHPVSLLFPTILFSLSICLSIEHKSLFTRNDLNFSKEQGFPIINFEIAKETEES